MSGDSFSFGTVSGPVNAGSGTQYNIGGNVSGNMNGNIDADLAVPEDVLRDLAELRMLLASLDLDPDRSTGTDGAESAADALADVEQSVAAADSAGIKSGWTRLTEILQSAGALASAGVTLADPLRRISQWVITLG